ncbi:MAG: adenylate/guanylate cyclase domain-containing protein [Pseudomonadota bacterium]
MERRLSAILAADVVGYSRLMEQDEVGTLAALKSLRKEILGPLIDEHGGQIVKLMGDGFLVRFPSAVAAVECALAWQDGRISASASSNALQFRIGVNLGDVVIDEEDIFGDGVNIAARLESLCQPGGVCISDIVHQNVVGRLETVFEDRGEAALKNINRKVRIWSWPIGTAVGGRVPSEKASPPEKFLLAILPFINLSSDPEVTQFAEGLTRDLVTEIGKFSLFSVTAPAAHNRGANRDAGALDVSRDLGAQYVLDGTVQVAGQRIRVSAQVTDVEMATQIWADRYNGSTEDLFTLQDDVTHKISGNLFHPLMKHAAQRARIKSQIGAKTYDRYLHCWHLIERPTAAGIEEARVDCEKIIDSDPDFVLVYELLAWVNIHGALNGWVEDPQVALSEAREAALRGISLDEKEAYLRSGLGMAEGLRGNIDASLRESQAAIDANPYDAEYPTFMGASLAFAGRLDEALAAFEKADRLSPGYPPIALFQGTAYLLAEQPGGAKAHLEQSLMTLPEYNWIRVCLAAALVALGQPDAARREVARLIDEAPRLTQGYLRTLLTPVNSQACDSLIVALQEAGLPE